MGEAGIRFNNNQFSNDSPKFPIQGKQFILSLTQWNVLGRFGRLRHFSTILQGWNESMPPNRVIPFSRPHLSSLFCIHPFWAWVAFFVVGIVLLSWGYALSQDFELLSPSSSSSIACIFTHLPNHFDSSHFCLDSSLKF